MTKRSFAEVRRFVRSDRRSFAIAIAGLLPLVLASCGGAPIQPGALVDGPVLMEADFGNEIDNMEGLDVWQDAGGATMLSVVSDDNGSFLQRNLYLEFRLVDEPAD